MQLPFPNSGTLGELGLTENRYAGYPGETKKKKREEDEEEGKAPARSARDEVDEEMDRAADEMIAAMGAEHEEEDERPKRKRRRTQEIYKNGKKVEIHSEKWHRCVDKVRNRKGGGAYNEYAVCTSSIGKAGSFRKGHGGRASK